MSAPVERPWQPWERNYSGGRIGVQEQQGADENWIILHVESGGAKTTTSLRLHEAWDLALRLSPQLKAEFDRRHAEVRTHRDALFSLKYRSVETDLLRRLAEEHDCGDNCEYSGGRCPRIDRDGCALAEADDLRQLADSIDACNASIEADVLRAIDSCGGAHDPANPEWSRGYDEALAAADREVKRLFARATGDAT